MWVCRLLMYANSAGNPVIYSLLSSNFQAAFWRLLSGRKRQLPRPELSYRSSLGHTSVTRYVLTCSDHVLPQLSGSKNILTPLPQP